jgi:hypothetical protein
MFTAISTGIFGLLDPALLAYADLARDAMEAHPGAVRVAQHSLALLDSLASHRPNRRPLMWCLGLVVEALVADPSEVDVAVNGLGLLGTLASRGTNQPRLLETAADAIFHALEVHASVPAVASSSLGLLASLAQCRSNRALLMAHVGAVQRAMTAHSGHVDVVQPGLVLLAELATTAANRVHLMPYLGTVAAALACYPIPAVLEPGLRMLGLLATLDGKAVAAALPRDSDPVGRVLRDRAARTNARSVHECLKLLRWLPVQSLMTHHHFVVRAMERYSTQHLCDDAVVIVCADALCTIAQHDDCSVADKVSHIMMPVVNNPRGVHQMRYSTASGLSRTGPPKPSLLCEVDPFPTPCSTPCPIPCPHLSSHLVLDSTGCDGCATLDGHAVGEPLRISNGSDGRLALLQTPGSPRRRPGGFGAAEGSGQQHQLEQHVLSRGTGRFMGCLPTAVAGSHG